MTKENELLHQLRYRAAPRPNLGVPFGVRSCGEYRVLAGWREQTPSKPFSEVFCCLDGCGRFGLEGRSHDLVPGQSFVYRAGQRHDLVARSSVWQYCWWTLDGPLAEALLDLLGLGAGVHAGSIDSAAFLALDAAVGDPSLAGERAASSLAYAACCGIAPGQVARTDELVKQALALIEEHWRDPGFGVSQCAALLAVNRSVLSRRFGQAIGLSPKAFLGRRRIQQACALLQGGRQPIAAVAQACGFADPDYFARAFRQAIGQSPSRFRDEGPQ